MTVKTHLIIHHTGAEEKDAAQVRAYHLRLGWQETGYNWIIERDGRVVPGRSPDIPGAHCLAGGMNRKGLGIALIGNFEVHPPSAPQTEALQKLIAQLREEYRIPAKNILGHRQVPGANTLCPGRYFPSTILTTPPPKFWRVQAGAFNDRERAYRLADELRRRGIEITVYYR